MPTSTVNWFWIGNRSIIDGTPNDRPSNIETQSVVGYMGSGPNSLASVAVTGDYIANASSPATGFVPQWAQYYVTPYTPTNFSYTIDGVSHSNLKATTMIAVTFRVQTGIDPDVYRDQAGVLVQMSNGDMFMRPNLGQENSWNDITNIYSVEIVSATNGSSLPAYSHTVGFNGKINDINFPCFTRGTHIETIKGYVAVEDLEVGDLIRTADNGYKPISWIGSQKLSALALHVRPNLKPVRIAAGALGAGLPARDLVVSPQHRILVNSKIVRDFLGTEEALIAAIHLIGLPSIEVISDCNNVEYFHIMFDLHEIIYAEELPTESLYLGVQAVKMLPADCREEIFSLFPNLIPGQVEPARLFVTGKQARLLATKHLAASLKMVA